MGSSSSTLQISYKVWPSGVTHETYTKIFNREEALTSYLPGERTSFGKVDKDILKYLFNDTFTIIDKGQNYLDGYRNKYSDIEECCTTDIIYKKEYNAILSCSNDTKTFNNDFCDEIMYKTCIDKGGPKCKVWIRAQVERKGKKFDSLYSLALKEEFRSHDLTISFLESLRDFATDTNKYNLLADAILDSYSDEIKYKEYKCAFPISFIIDKEKYIKIPKECWFKDCSLSPLYKLKTENIRKRDLCNITICDININQLNMSKQDVQIICKNKYNNQSIDISKLPIKQDIDNFFLIPEFKNMILPFYTLLSLCFLFNK